MLLSKELCEKEIQNANDILENYNKVVEEL